MRRRRTRHHAGFTLIEIMIAMFIFMAGVAGIYGLLSTALGLQRGGLETGRLSRRLDAVVFQLEQDLSDGVHWDAATEAWVDVEFGQLPDGTVFSAHFVPEQGNERLGTLLVELRLAGGRAALARASPVSYMLTPGPTPAAAARAFQSTREPR